MPSHDEYEEFESSAPRPVDDRLVKKGNLQQLERGQGAVQASRETANSQRAQAAPQALSGRTIAIVAAIGAVVIALVVFLMIRILSGPVPNSGNNNASSEVEQTTVGANESFHYRGSTYYLVETGKGYALAESRDESADKVTTLGDLNGTPVNLVLYDGAVIIPENLSNGTWDVVAYTIGSGWSQILGQDGNAYGGTGTISEANLNGSTLHLVVDGSPVDIPLEW